jgi:hypothetical protein
VEATVAVQAAIPRVLSPAVWLARSPPTWHTDRRRAHLRAPLAARGPWPVAEVGAPPRAGNVVAGEAAKRSCTGRTASSANEASGDGTKRGGVPTFATGC